MWLVRCSFCIGNKNHRVCLLIVLHQEASNKLLVIYNNLIFNENVSTLVSWKQFSWRNNFVSQNIISVAFHIRRRFWQELWNGEELKQKQAFHRKHIWHHWFLFMLNTCSSYNSDCFFSRATMHNSCSQSQGDRLFCCKQLNEIKSSIISVDPLVQQFLCICFSSLSRS